MSLMFTAFSNHLCVKVVVSHIQRTEAKISRFPTQDQGMRAKEMSTNGSWHN